MYITLHQFESNNFSVAFSGLQLAIHTSTVERFNENFDQEAVTHLFCWNALISKVYVLKKKISFWSKFENYWFSTLSLWPQGQRVKNW